MSEVTIRKYKSGDLPEMIAVWNEVVEGGVAFPQEEMLDSVGGEKFFAAQTYCGVAEVDEKVLGLYILHPNNIGRCGHICNASYAVSSKSRGRTSVKSWCSTASIRHMKRASECSSSTPSSGRTSTRATSMSASASNSSALSPAASE